MRIQGRAKNVALVVGVVVFLPFAWLAVFTSPDLSQNVLLEKRVAELRDRLHQAESLNQDRENDIHSLRQQLSLLVRTHTHGNTNQSEMSGSANNYSLHVSLGDYLQKFYADVPCVECSSGLQVVIPKETRELLANLSLGSSDLQPPSMFHHLPHLIGKPEGLRPAYKLSQGRMGVSIVIGIPHIKRENQNYLFVTLSSLLDNLNDEERLDTLIVVFIGEPDDQEYVKKVGEEVKSKYQTYLTSGVLEVIAPSHFYYPNLNNLKSTFGDPAERIKWRTKQNLDFAYLMMYARSRGTYYVQLEDDVITKPDYMSTMKNFALNQKMDEWILLEFSHLGFIGKLFKSSDLPMVVEFFLMFYKDKPIDWLLDHLLFVKICNPEKDNLEFGSWPSQGLFCRRDKERYSIIYKPYLFEYVPGVIPQQIQWPDPGGFKHCRRSVAELRRRFKPSLFQHIGTHSSLKGKVQKLKDKDFGRGQLRKSHVNPNAEVSTSLKAYQRNTIDRAYMGESIFWSTFPHAQDHVTFAFMPPVIIEKFVFRSGHAEHPGDKFFNTSVEVLPTQHVGKESGILNNDAHEHGYRRTKDGFLVIGKFDDVTGLAEGVVDPSLGLIDTMRLHVHTDSQAWVILSEIYIKQTDSKS